MFKTMLAAVSVSAALLVPQAQAVLPPGASFLASYDKADNTVVLSAIGGNLSGITYNYDTDTYFLIQNNSGRIFEYDRSFSKPLRVITLKNLDDNDTEDIVYLGKDEYAISSEENRVLIIKITAGQTAVDADTDRSDVQLFQLPGPRKDNKGLEGVCYTARSQTGRGTFFAVQEDKPKRIFKFTRPNNSVDVSSSWRMTYSEPFPVESMLKHRMSDLSACYVEDQTGHLLLLSHESSRIMEVDHRGHIYKMLDLPRNPDQFEGMTVGADQEIVLVSEPNVVVILKPKN